MKLMDVLFGRMIDRKIVEYQSDLMEKLCEEVQNIYETMTLTCNRMLNCLAISASILSGASFNANKS